MDLFDARIAKARTVAALMRSEVMTSAPLMIPVASEAEADAVVGEMTGKAVTRRPSAKSRKNRYGADVELVQSKQELTLLSDDMRELTLPAASGQLLVVMDWKVAAIDTVHLDGVIDVVGTLRKRSNEQISKKKKPKKAAYPLNFSVGLTEVAADNFSTVVTVFTPYAIKPPAGLRKAFRRFDQLGTIRYCETQRLSAGGKHRGGADDRMFRPGMSVSPKCGTVSSIGCFVVRSGQEDRPLLLGSGHGLSGYGTHESGQIHCFALKQKPPHRPIGNLVFNGFNPANHSSQVFDCALAELGPSVPFQNVLWAKMELKGVRANLPRTDEQVHVFGCKTEANNGSFVSETEVEIDIVGRNGATYHYTNLIAFEGDGCSASHNGDSGGLVTDEHGWALGLVIGGSHRRGPKRPGLSHAMPLQPLFNHLDLKLHATGVTHAVD